jgi:opacity protein-like surface antigen
MVRISHLPQAVAGLPNKNNVGMKTIYILFLVLSIICIPSWGLPQTEDNGEPVPEFVPEDVLPSPVYSFPEIAPDIVLSGGYRFVDVTGSERVGEFEYLEDSFTLGGQLKLFSFPHRLHIVLDYKNRKDYFGDITYAYRDIFYFRGINRTLFHNLENIGLIDLNAASSSPGLDIRDDSEKYGIKVGLSRFFFRVKTPDFPFHVYVDGNIQDKEGRKQQRNILGSGYFNNIVRASQGRDVDWTTKNISVGVNSHVGPVEIDYSYGEKRFDVNGSEVLWDNYTAAGFTPPASVRNPGMFPHNLVPELESSSNTIKLHTSYTGSLVAAASIKTIEKKNKESHAEADYFFGTGEVTWIASPVLAFFLRYRHKDADIDNSRIVNLYDLCSPSLNSGNDYNCAIKPSLSSETNTITGTVRYRPLSKLTLRARYSYKDIDRENADAWNLPDSTEKNTVSLNADLRLLRDLKLKARYRYKDITSPAYNTEPDYSNEGRISLSWSPYQRMRTALSYNVLEERRDDIHFLSTEEAKNRELSRKQFMGNVTVFIFEDLSLTAGYAYIRNSLEQDIVYADADGAAVVDLSVPYRDTAHSYLIDIHYIPVRKLTFNTGLSHTVSKGSFSPGSEDLLQPVSIATFSELKTEETVFSVSGEYDFLYGLTCSLEYRYADFDDVLDNPHDDIKDGEAHILALRISKRW